MRARSSIVTSLTSSVAFVGDADGSRLRATYFETFKRPVWDQADWVSISGSTGGMVIFGRADGVLCVARSPAQS